MTLASELSLKILGESVCRCRDGSQYRVDAGVNTNIVLQSAATTGVEVSNVQENKVKRVSGCDAVNQRHERRTTASERPINYGQ